MIMLDGNSGVSDDVMGSAPSRNTGNDSAAVKKTAPKQEEEISIEDIPF